jgi:hypothetical protein
MRQKIKAFEFRFVLGKIPLASRLTDTSIDLFHLVEQTSTQHLLSEYSSFVRARGGTLIISSSVFNQKYELPAYLLTTTSRWE